MKTQKELNNSGKIENIGERLNAALFMIQAREQIIDTKSILKLRAKELAKSLPSETRGEYFEYIQFGLASELFGIEKKFIKEVFPLKDLTPLPCVPAFVIGIINVRGKIISVIDLKKLYDLPDAGITELNRVIILQHNQLEFGILADRILGVEKAYLDELKKSLPTLTEMREDFLRGITPERVVVLDHEKLMNDNRLIVNEQVL